MKTIVEFINEKREPDATSFHVGDYIFRCWTTDTRSGFCHHATVYNKDYNNLGTKRLSYLNRTWESWRYQSICQHACDKLIPKADRAAVREILDKDTSPKE